MTRHQLLTASAFAIAIFGSAVGPAVSTAHAQRVSIGVGIGVPAPYYHRPYYAPYPYYRPYYYPPPVVVAPPPVVYQPAPVIVQQPVVQQPVVVAQPAYSSPATTSPPPIVETGATVTAIDAHLANLRNTDENIRRTSVLELGRMKATSAVQPLTATLAGDQSPAVRETAARALGLIGSPQGLIALEHAAQADPDRDVRNSARFAVDIIRTNNR